MPSRLAYEKGITIMVNIIDNALVSREIFPLDQLVETLGKIRLMPGTPRVCIKMAF